MKNERSISGAVWWKEKTFLGCREERKDDIAVESNSPSSDARDCVSSFGGDLSEEMDWGGMKWRVDVPVRIEVRGRVSEKSTIGLGRFGGCRVPRRVRTGVGRACWNVESREERTFGVVAGEMRC